VLPRASKSATLILVSAFTKFCHEDGSHATRGEITLGIQAAQDMLGPPWCSIGTKTALYRARAHLTHQTCLHECYLHRDPPSKQSQVFLLSSHFCAAELFRVLCRSNALMLLRPSPSDHMQMLCHCSAYVSSGSCPNDTRMFCDPSSLGAWLVVLNAVSREKLCKSFCEAPRSPAWPVV